MILLVDIGNTRVKWATQVDGRLSPQRAAGYAQWSAVD
jgi:pantothenate kinase type III